MLFQLLHHDFDGLVELSVVSLTVRRWIQIHLVVRRNAMVLHFPLAVKTVDGGTWSRNATAVEEFGIAADADKPSPGSFADERAHAGFTEIPRQRVAAGAGHLVDDHHLRPVDRFRWARPVVAFPGDNLAHERALQVV